MNKVNLLIVFVVALVSYSCSDPAITDDLLDGPVIFDPSLYNPEQWFLQNILIPPPPI
jgi:carboxylesterase